MKITFLLFGLIFAAPSWAQSVHNNCPAGASNCFVTATGGTNSRTLAARAADVANVLDFTGSDPTGASNQSAVFTAALARSKRVVVPRGTYGFTDMFTVPAGESEIYCDKGATLKALPNSVGYASFFSTGASVTKLTIKGCGFDGNADNIGLDKLFFQAYQSTNVVCDDCYFTNNRWHIAGFANTTKSGIKNSRFANVGNWGKARPNTNQAVNAASLAGSFVLNFASTTDILEGMSVYDTSGHLPYATRVVSKTSTTVTVSNAVTAGGIADTTLIQFQGYPYTVIVSYSQNGTDNFFDNNFGTDVGGDIFDAGTQTRFTSRNNTIISDNTGFVLPGNSGAGSGMYLFNSSTDFVVANNFVYGLTGNGLDLGCVSNGTVSGNTLLHNGGAGIAFSAEATCDSNNVSITGNTTNNNLQGRAGLVSLSTNGITAAGNSVLNFADTTGVVAGMFIYDASSGVWPGTQVVSTTSTTVTMNIPATGGGVASAAPIVFLNKYSRIPAPNAGLWVGCAPVGVPCDIGGVVVSGHVATDTQGTKTQAYGINQTADVVATNIKYAAGNVVFGNLTSDLNNVLLTDQGSGSNAWACWPGYSVVASGAFGSMACGYSATASGLGSLAMGTGVVSSGIYGVTMGQSSADRGMVGKNCYATGQFSASGDMQICDQVVRGTGSSTSAIRMTTNGSAASTTNCINPPNNSKFSMSAEIVIADSTTAEYAVWTLSGAGLKRGANAAATTVAATVFPTWTKTSASNATASGWSAPTLTADTTNGCANISWTPPGANTDTFWVGGRVQTVEIVK